MALVKLKVDFTTLLIEVESEAPGTKISALFNRAYFIKMEFF